MFFSSNQGGPALFSSHSVIGSNFKHLSIIDGAEMPPGDPIHEDGIPEGMGVPMLVIETRAAD